MKKWLYFKRTNGDQDCMPNRPKLDNDKKRRAFIGDPGATDFVLSDVPIVQPERPEREDEIKDRLFRQWVKQKKQQLFDDHQGVN